MPASPPTHSELTPLLTAPLAKLAMIELVAMFVPTSPPTPSEFAPPLTLTAAWLAVIVPPLFSPTRPPPLEPVVTTPLA